MNCMDEGRENGANDTGNVGAKPGEMSTRVSIKWKVLHRANALRLTDTPFTAWRCVAR